MDKEKWQELERKIEACRREIDEQAKAGCLRTELMEKFEAYCNEIMQIIEQHQGKP